MTRAATGISGSNTAEMEKAVEQLTAEVNGVLRDAVDEGVAVLQSISPVFTGWYINNHRVAPGVDTDDLPLSPNQRSEMTQDQLPDIVTREQSNIEQVTITEGAIIGNAVDYAEKIEEGRGDFRSGPGDFYNRAAGAIAGRIERSGNA